MLLNEYSEIDELVGKFRHTQHIRRIGYREAGTLRSMVLNWEDSGIPERPHQVLRAPLMVTVGEDGMRRIHLTRELDRYVELGAPFVKTGGVWGQVALGTPTRTGNRLSWSRTQADMWIDLGGDFIKMAILLKGGFVPENRQIAFPVGMQGFTRQGLNLFRDGIKFARLNMPVMLDRTNPFDSREINNQFVNLNGQAYWLMTLPSLAGMVEPVIDPTLSLQPDGTAGKDVVMLSASATFNYGAYSDLDAGERNDGTGTGRSLIQFDLTSIPAEAQVTSATFSLFQFLDLSSNIRTFSLYRMIRAWTEGTGTGSATGDGATWNTYDGTNNWGTAGADNTTSDRQSTVLGSRSMTASEANNAFKDWTLTNSLVQDWISGAFSNNGMLLRAATETDDMYLYRSSDHATAAERPKLEVIYSLLVAPKYMYYQRLRQ